MKIRKYSNIEKLAYAVFLFSTIIVVNLSIGFISYVGLEKNLQIISADISDILNKNIEDNKSLANALGYEIPLPENQINHQLGVDINKEIQSSKDSAYHRKIHFSPKEINKEDSKVAVIIMTLWNNLSAESKSKYWTYYTNKERKHYFLLNSSEFMHYKDDSPNLKISDFIERLSSKLNTAKGFLASDNFYSNVYVDAMTGLPTITVGAPVIINNVNIESAKIMGVIVTDYTLDDLDSIFKNAFLEKGLDISLYSLSIKSKKQDEVPLQINKVDRVITLPEIKVGVTDGFYICGHVGVADVVKNSIWLFVISNIIMLIFTVAFRNAYIRTNRALHRLSYDSLTNALSREGGDIVLGTLSASDDIMMVVTDLDNFKNINDSYGHHVGDLALKYFVDTLHANLRATDKIIRMGGDEFLLLLAKCDHSVAENTLLSVGAQLQHFSYDEVSIPLSCSYGLHKFTGDFSDDYQNADLKLYEMKRNPGRNSALPAGSSLSEMSSQTHEDTAASNLLTLDELRKHPEYYAGRSLLAMLHLNNYSSLKSLLGVEYSRAHMAYFISRIKKTLPDNILLCRERSDTLIVIFPPSHLPDQLNVGQQQLSEIFTLHEGAQMGNHELRIVGSASMVEEELIPERFNEILLNAGIALHHLREKENGTVTLFTSEMHEEGLHQILLHEQLRLALDGDEFHLVMQPIINLEKGNTCREGECLVRWNSPVLGFVPPDKFISLAEETGLMIPLGEWIVENACKQLAAFISRGAPEDFKLHINISPLQLQQQNFAQSLLESMKSHELLGKNICLEITEGMLLESNDHILAQLTRLRDTGVTISLDDFGSGYSSLSYLHTLPFDQLKIDRQFVNNLLTDSRSESVVDSVLTLSRNFNVPLVAEGIEDNETGEKLRTMGCQLAQGYFYGRPQPFDSWTFNGDRLV
uniref:bifunctional diguanylate cyclase/phosphodiesterase n=1 Tax=Scandinavium goeteborgense TaxID=1851514 RepID=UPI0013598A53|nr:bifunctional diguanylate cyclase/phosphodiesterase [Scandinavium goeteborgense]